MQKVFSSREAAIKSAIALVLLALGLYVLTFLTEWMLGVTQDAEALKAFIVNLGFFGPFALIALQTLQVLIAPIPGQVLGLGSGFVYGPILGSLCSISGMTLGSYILFVLAKKYGRPFVESVVNKAVLKRFDGVAKEKGGFALFLIFLFPAFPDDILCLVAGLSPLKTRTLTLLAFFGRLPSVVLLNVVGHGLSVNQTQIAYNIFAVALFLAVPTYVFREEIEAFIHRWL